MRSLWRQTSFARLPPTDATANLSSSSMKFYCTKVQCSFLSIAGLDSARSRAFRNGPGFATQKADASKGYLGSCSVAHMTERIEQSAFELVLAWIPYHGRLHEGKRESRRKTATFQNGFIYLG